MFCRIVKEKQGKEKTMDSIEKEFDKFCDSRDCKNCPFGHLECLTDCLEEYKKACELNGGVK